VRRRSAVTVATGPGHVVGVDRERVRVVRRGRQELDRPRHAQLAVGGQPVDALGAWGDLVVARDVDRDRSEAGSRPISSHRDRMTGRAFATSAGVALSRLISSA
jgi:hypothetical protein